MTTEIHHRLRARARQLSLDALRKLAGRLGHSLVPGQLDSTKPYRLHTYLDAKGRFDHQRYVEVQTAGNRRKLDMVWVQRENIELLARYVEARIPNPGFGLCHGTRRGLEQRWFAECLPGASVLGTEISDTASQFPDTLQWDFHEVKEEWLGRAAFVYSNSFDHAYDPEKALRGWMRCLVPGGLCLIEHSSRHGPAGASELDPFGAELVEMPYLVARWGKGAFSVRDIIDLPKSKSKNITGHVLVVAAG
jgi:hypothetical protein